ncbi:hypothetical protein [Marivirga arenosa]|uniref:Outer membrane protein beta-barrel domain-containing protein n=1 Tax=Marivirga arenosa TaxID=3059076 RepID=A0AA51ZY06_9BACT|nr:MULTISPECIES: hypothetical protein [unclassified Marivirga]WKK83902.2 hypothetical protein QYS48_16795 [Marivirga sp. ABR2-2]WNB18836.1 hypothetical protein QYS47_31520 [Marivirga sp. BKB1-2]
MKIFIITISFIVLASIQLVAQSSCERNLNEARADYSSGNLYAVPGKLNDCLENGFDKTQKIVALRLLTLTYININQQEKARSTLIKLLNIKTDYQVIDNVDPSELYSLYNSIDTDIKYFIGVTFGTNLNYIRLVDYRSTNPLGNEAPNYIPKFSLEQIGIQYLYPLVKSIVVGAELQYQNQRYGYFERNESLDGSFTTIEYQSSNSGINLNLMARYMKDFYQWKPFVEIGATGRGNFNYQISNYINGFSESVDEENIAGPESVLDRRAIFNFAVNANIGTMIKIGENYGEVKLGVSNYFRNHLNDLARQEAVKTTVLNGMVLKDDDIANLVFQLNLTFNIPFFNFQ